jgi:hypothetical protein
VPGAVVRVRPYRLGLARYTCAPRPNEKAPLLFPPHVSLGAAESFLAVVLASLYNRKKKPSLKRHEIFGYGETLHLLDVGSRNTHANFRAGNGKAARKARIGFRLFPIFMKSHLRVKANTYRGQVTLQLTSYHHARTTIAAGPPDHTLHPIMKSPPSPTLHTSGAADVVR